MVEYSLKKETENNFILETDEVIVDLNKTEFGYINDFVNLNRGCFLTLKGEEEAYLQLEENSEIITISPIVNFKTPKRDIVIHLTYDEYMPQLVDVLCNY